MAQFTPAIAALYLSDEQRFNVAAAHALVTGNSNAYNSLLKAVSELETTLTGTDQLSDLAYWAMKNEINSLTLPE